MGQPQGQMVPRLRAWREYKLLTPTELAAKAGVSLNTVSRLESAKSRQRASLRMIGKLADALGIERAQLLDETPPQRRHTH